MIRINYIEEAKSIYNKHRQDSSLTEEQAYASIAWDLYTLVEEMQQFLDDLCDQIEQIERMESEGT